MSAIAFPSDGFARRVLMGGYDVVVVAGEAGFCKSGCCCCCSAIDEDTRDSPRRRGMRILIVRG